MAGKSVIEDLQPIVEFYSRTDIIEALLNQTKGKEVGICFNMKYYGSRPDVLTSRDDIITLVRGGATSFHISEETWSDPLMLKVNNTKPLMDEIRTGWDLIFDVDVDDIEHSKICAHFLINKLKQYGITPTVKFSGGKGMHVAVPFEAFPETFNGVPIAELFPDAPRFIVDFVREEMREEFTNYFNEHFNIERIEKKIRLDLMNEMEPQFIESHIRNNYYKKGKFDPFTIIEVDTVLIAPRHLYRMLYSINEKSGLVSIPIPIEKVRDFNLDLAKPENVKSTDVPFLNRDIEPGCATELLVQAYDAQIKKILKEEEKKKMLAFKERDLPKIPEEFFPPCINCALGGMKDGKKRSMFIMQNFLSQVGWTTEDMEVRFNDWNKQHEEPLRQTYINTQLKYNDRVEKKLPPNCDNKSYYQDLGICKPDNLCKMIKNPVSYTLKKSKKFVDDELKQKKVKDKKDTSNDTKKESIEKKDIKN